MRYITAAVVSGGALATFLTAGWAAAVLAGTVVIVVTPAICWTIADPDRPGRLALLLIACQAPSARDDRDDADDTDQITGDPRRLREPSSAPPTDDQVQPDPGRNPTIARPSARGSIAGQAPGSHQYRSGVKQAEAQKLIYCGNRRRSAAPGLATAARRCWPGRGSGSPAGMISR